MLTLVKNNIRLTWLNNPTKEIQDSEKQNQLKQNKTKT